MYHDAFKSMCPSSQGVLQKSKPILIYSNNQERSRTQWFCPLYYFFRIPIYSHKVLPLLGFRKMSKGRMEIIFPIPYQVYRINLHNILDEYAGNAFWLLTGWSDRHERKSILTERLEDNHIRLSSSSGKSPTPASRQNFRWGRVESTSATCS